MDLRIVRLLTLVVVSTFLAPIAYAKLAPSTQPDAQLLAASDPAAKEMLAVNVGPAHFRGEAIADAFHSLRTSTKLNIFVNWKSLEAVGIKHLLPLTLDVSNLPLDRALDRMLD